MKGISTYEFFIAKRYLRSKRRTRFISIITYISVGGVALGVAALIIVLSLMNGFATEIRNRIVGMDAHVRVEKFHQEGIEDYEGLARRLEGMDGIVAASPVVYGEAMVVSRRVSKAGAVVKGTEARGIGRVSDLGSHLVDGEIRLDGRPDEGPPGIVLGYSLANRLQLGIGDTLWLISPGDLSLRSAAWGVPKMWSFVIKGLFETGMYDFDASLAIVSIPSAQRIFGLGERVTGMEVRVRDMFRARVVASQIGEALGYPYYAIGWMDLHKHLFSWMTIEKWGSFTVLTLIVLVAAFNIVSTLIMVVMEKTKEIGILRAMGATRRSVQRIFMLEGATVGVVGTAIGCVLGYGLCQVQATFKLVSLPGDIYFINSLPVEMRGFDFAWIAAVTMLICFLASVYPARKAASLDPVEAIRYE